MTLGELAKRVGATVEGDAQTVIEAVGPIETAGPGAISFIANSRYSRFVETTRASALILDPDTPCTHIPVIRHPNPYFAYAQIVALLYPDQPQTAPGVHADSVIEWDVNIDESSRIGPLCHLRHGTVIGRNCQLVSSVYVGEDVQIGDNCLFYPGVRILNGSKIGNNVILHSGVVIGSDGFGFAPSEKGLKKIKQVGWVEIADDVEIGSNTTVDRGAIGPTKIGRGTKIDNLVQIAHNVEIGENAIIVAQVGISGSTKVGNRAILAGQVGLVGHIEIGDDVQVGAQSGVAKSLAAGKTVLGSPARDIMQAKRIEAALSRLPDLFKRVRKLESDEPKKSGD
ncbi:MAG: UDP-3-O-(3-hydroxymyristoyl)glucosamine N-acyltransferase [bacterium]|nr:UDP-3-O-(3-hydroxymyristoyl)glucosamine N-acyltransferase [bacterium]